MFLINEPADFPDVGRADLAEFGEVFDEGPNVQCEKIQAAFVRLAERIDAQFLDKYPNLRYVVSPTTGHTHIDESELNVRGVQLISLKGELEFLSSIRATAEHSLGLALSLLRKIPAACVAAKEGRWTRYGFKGREICGKNVLIIGYGRVGRQVADLYDAFGAQVKAYDIVKQKVPEQIYVNLEAGLSGADIISLHVNYEKENHQFLNERWLRLCKPSALLINTSRGELIDQNLLIDMLSSNRLSGAALDVLQNEPSPDLDLDAVEQLGEKLLITPHIAGFTEESLAMVERFVVKKFISIFCQRATQ